MYRIASAIAAVALLLAAACSKDRSESDTTLSAGAVADTPGVVATFVPPGGTPVTIAVSEKDGSVFLTDAAGHALYIADKTPACTGADCGGFAPVTGKGTAGAPAVKAELIGVTTLPDGSLQITYADHPLYTYNEDMTASDTKGQGKKANGATYNLVNPQGAKVTSSAAKR